MDANTSGDRLKIGVIENPANPLGFKQSGAAAEFETMKISARIMLLPVTVIAEGKVTVTEDSAMLLL